MNKPCPSATAQSRSTLVLTVAAAWFALAPLLPAVALDAAVQQKFPLTPPLPPPRPVSPDGVPTTATVQPAAVIPAAPEYAPVPPHEAPRQPRSLPPASRARMHACGLEWQKLKQTGGAADKTWYEFAKVCLVK